MAAAIKEYNELLRKAHWDKEFQIWRSLSGPAEMVRVDIAHKWSDLDTQLARDPKFKDYQADLARINARINESFVSSSRIVELVDPKASFSSGGTPKMIEVWTAHVKEDKVRDAIDLERNEYAPAMKAAGVKMYNFSQTRFGAPTNEIRSVTALENWAELDNPNPVRKTMGDEKYRAFSEKMNALLEDFSYNIYRYDAELSYVPAK